MLAGLVSRHPAQVRRANEWFSGIAGYACCSFERSGIGGSHGRDAVCDGQCLLQVVHTRGKRRPVRKRSAALCAGIRGVRSASLRVQCEAR